MKNDHNRDEDEEGEDVEDGEATPTPSISLASSASNGGCGSLAVTPVHRPRQQPNQGCEQEGEEGTK